MSSERWSTWILEGPTPARLIQLWLGIDGMRTLCAAHGIEPKGFRLAKAPAARIAALLVERAPRDEDLREDLARALAASAPEAGGAGAAGSVAETGGPPGTGSAAEAPAEAKADEPAAEAVELRARRAERRADREADSARKARAKRDAALGELRTVREALAEETRRVKALERERASLSAQIAAQRMGSKPDEARDAVERRLGEAAERIAELEQVDRDRRVELAASRSRIRELEAEVAELEGLLPRGQKERRKQRARSYEEARTAGTLLPQLEPEFVAALGRLPETDQRRVFAALGQVVLHGLDLPGLAAKNLKGKGDLWSVRAGIHLRVYFVRDGDRLRLVHVGTREEQDGFLKRWSS